MKIKKTLAAAGNIESGTSGTQADALPLYQQVN